MKRFWWLPLLLFIAYCGKKPRPYTDLHIVSVPEANEGKALPFHVIPVDGQLFVRISTIKPEEWFVSEMVETTPGIQKRVFKGRDTNIIRVERVDDKNNFLVITDFGNTESVEAQRIYIGEKNWRDKDIYLLVTRDQIRVIDKATYERSLGN